MSGHCPSFICCYGELFRYKSREFTGKGSEIISSIIFGYFEQFSDSLTVVLYVYYLEQLGDIIFMYLGWNFGGSDTPSI